MRVNPCGWAVDVARRTGLYGVYPLADDENAFTWIQTWFTTKPPLPFPHVFTNSDFYEDRYLQPIPGWSVDWKFHKLRKGPQWNLLPPSIPIGTLSQWLGQTYSDQPPVPVDANGFCPMCYWQVVLDEQPNTLAAFVLGEDGSVIFMESQTIPIT